MTPKRKFDFELRRDLGNTVLADATDPDTGDAGGFVTIMDPDRDSTITMEVAVWRLMVETINKRLEDDDSATVERERTMLREIVRETIYGDGTDASLQRTIDLCNEAVKQFGIRRLEPTAAPGRFGNLVAVGEESALA